MMHRWVVRTRTAVKKSVFIIMMITDALALITALVCYPVFVEAIKNDCDASITFFLLVVGSYALMAPLRMFIIIAHFMFGQRFWRWVKRHVTYLNVVEYEQRVEFDIYKAIEYVEKVNEAVRA